jgi:hypothetical protein
MTMRMSELNGRPVVDPSGQSLGQVNDVRLVRDAPFGEPNALRVAGVIAGKGGVAVRLGYTSPDVPGPWLLSVLFGALARNARYIPWENVELSPGRLMVTVPANSLKHPKDVQ